MNRHVRAYAFKAAEPPNELQLWNPGDNPTDYGVHRWTARSAREVIATYQARGNPLQIDVEHNNAEAPGTDDPPPQGGYARLELRGGVPWLIFDWSAYAVEQIRSRQRLFLSPEYDVDRTTNEIVRLVRVSLVADAGTYHARMLARAKRVRAGGSNVNLALILAALRAALSAEDPETSRTQIATLIDEISKMAGDEGGGDDGAAPPQPETAAADADGANDAPPPADDPRKKEQTFAASASTSPEVMKMAQRLATLEAAERARAAEARVHAAGARIPESLRTFARSLSERAFAAFVAGLPEVSAEVETETPTRLKAASRVTRGDKTARPMRPEGELDAETARHMARIFANENRPEKTITELDDGRVRASHLRRRPNTVIASEGN